MQPTSVRQHLAVDAWLRAFASAVRERDYDAAVEMFAEGSAGFGTVAGRWDGRAQLEREQWQVVWSRTSGFEFDLGTARCWDAEGLSIVITEWSSHRGPDDERPRRRAGRATIALIRDGDDLRAVHTHFSMEPGTPA